MTSITTTRATPAQASLDRVAAGSSFYAAMRILPPGQRQGMHAVYGFCRAVDDIADDQRGARDERAARLAEWRSAIHSLYRNAPVPLVATLVTPVAEFGLRETDFLAVIDGMEMDVQADIQAPTEAELDLYCDRVASAVGRLSVRIFGLPDNQGIPLAHHLGRALQLTNILRDIDEDAALDRLYLPRELLLAAGITTSDPLVVSSDPNIAQVCDVLAARAHKHFATARDLMKHGPRERVRCPRIMADVYEAVLDKLVSRGWLRPRARVHTPKLRALFAMVRYGLL